MTEASAFEKAVDDLYHAARFWGRQQELGSIDGTINRVAEGARAALLAQHDRDIAAAVAAEQARMAENSTEGFIAALNRFEGAIQNRDSEGFRAARADVLVARERDIAAEVASIKMERDAQRRLIPDLYLARDKARADIAELRLAVAERDARIRALEEALSNAFGEGLKAALSMAREVHLDSGLDGLDEQARGADIVASRIGARIAEFDARALLATGEQK